ncbi:uncharacterized protein SCHCODRAFT_02748723 [Schizophyllum commune H4-8]|nr:uncharacterized protein SCHCODRAFT_02748723 [Schizophyllum commune H4-8]KAI5892531.1 hypothetical protein SCHCODRAFT_02748723 [Schizophyllum commune H4-8]
MRSGLTSALFILLAALASADISPGCGDDCINQVCAYNMPESCICDSRLDNDLRACLKSNCRGNVNGVNFNRALSDIYQYCANLPKLGGGSVM